MPASLTRRCSIVVALCIASSAAIGFGPPPEPLPDLFQPGSQPSDTYYPIESSVTCSACHGFYLDELQVEAEPYDTWVASMMAQSARDPVWHAAVSVANQDVPGSGEFCIRCHAPRGWLGGRSTTGEISQLTNEDLDGVTCHFCHRMVDPVLGPDSPVEDGPILEALAKQNLIPIGAGNARYVFDPNDVRRGPFALCTEPDTNDCEPPDIPFNFHNAPIIESPFHGESEFCGTCHDVSTPTFMKQDNGDYLSVLDGLPHPTQDPQDMFPEQRTYSEWANSAFADGGVLFEDGRFGGNHPTGVMESCQDCHVPDVFAGGCFFWTDPPFFARPNLPQHSFAGANTWVLRAVFDQYGVDSGLTEVLIDEALDRTTTMLRNASDMDLAQVDDDLLVTVTNWSGHKLPTGYPEGRRLWLNVKFLDAEENILDEHGAYDFATGDLEHDTKIYEARQGVDEHGAKQSGLPVGAEFHLVFSNKIFYDNRIPPVGFTNEAFEAANSQPVGYAYADGQHWDDTYFDIPACATQAVVTLYYQTSSKEYMEFLRDETADGTGLNAYTHWENNGRSAPVDMDAMVIDLVPAPGDGDTNADGVVNVEDLVNVIVAWGVCDPRVACPADIDCNGVVDVQDLIAVILNWS
ncbi:MAG: hypothetical protein ACYTF9_00040 [Planctomycetota bacterium]|jgi:hypothetical protein